MSPDLSPAQQALLAARLRGRTGAAAAGTVAGIGRAGPEPAPISAEQEQLLVHSLFAPGSRLYNEVTTIVRTGPLDVDALRRAFERLVARHQMWRTTFRRIERRYRQVVGPVAVALAVHDLRDVPPAEREDRAAGIVAAAALPPYDLGTGPLVRPVLVRMDEEQHRLYLAMHHIVFDGVSLARIVLPELIALYDAEVAGRPAALPEPMQAADYATWQAGGVLDAELARHLPYWRARLDGAPTLRLPLDHPRPVEPRHRGTPTWFEVPAPVVAALRDRGVRASGTLVQILLAAFALLLRRYTDQQEVVLATVADLRRRRELESMLGYCLAPVPLRLKVADGAPFDDLVRSVRGELLDALPRVLPFGRLVSALDPPREPGANPIFQAMLVVQPFAVSPDPAWQLHPLDAGLGGDFAHAKADVMMELDERPDGRLTGRFVHDADLFEPGFGPAVVADWLRLLAEVGTPVTAA